MAAEIVADAVVDTVVDAAAEAAIVFLRVEDHVVIDSVAADHETVDVIVTIDLEAKDSVETAQKIATEDQVDQTIVTLIENLATVKEAIEDLNLRMAHQKNAEASLIRRCFTRL